MRAEVAKKAADGKARDDIRGQRIIPDYSDVHKPAASEGSFFELRGLAFVCSTSFAHPNILVV